MAFKDILLPTCYPLQSLLPLFNVDSPALTEGSIAIGRVEILDEMSRFHLRVLLITRNIVFTLVIVTTLIVPIPLS